MKNYINLPFIVIGLTFVIGISLWSDKRDAHSFGQYCDTNPEMCDIGW